MFSREQERPCLFSEEVDGPGQDAGAGEEGGGGYLGQREQLDQKQEKI